MSERISSPSSSSGSALAVALAPAATGAARATVRRGRGGRPAHRRDFEPLYAQNCAGCHGARGEGGAAIGLASPAYLAIAPDATDPPTSSPMAAGDRDAGVRAERRRHAHRRAGRRHRRTASGRWAPGDARPADMRRLTWRPHAGDPARGAEVFRDHCASLPRRRRPGRRQGRKLHRRRRVPRPGQRPGACAPPSSPGGPIWAPRTGASAGGSPMSPQDVTDVVAWLAAQRERVPRPALPRSTSEWEEAMNDPTISPADALVRLGLILNGVVGAAPGGPDHPLPPVAGTREPGGRRVVDLARAGASSSPRRDAPRHLPQPGGRARRTARRRTSPAGCGASPRTKFQVFAINCAHLGCPVRWFPQSGLFMCPCHGGAYYADGSRASGPPERGLFEYRLQDRAEDALDRGAARCRRPVRPPGNDGKRHLPCV